MKLLERLRESTTCKGRLAIITKEEKKQVRRIIKQSGNVVQVLSKLDRAFSVAVLDAITFLYNNGHSIETIAIVFNRNEHEIMFAIYHQMLEGNITRPFAYRLK